MHTLNTIENCVHDAIQQIWSIDVSSDMKATAPPDLDLGDLAFGCFVLAKHIKTNPAQLASELAEKLGEYDCIALATAVGPYVNIKINPALLFSELGLKSIKTGTHLTSMVEYLSPNTNKPIHLGHLRNGVLGKALAHMLEWSGVEVVKACLVNDRGIHICKSMLAWMLFGQGATPESSGKKGDHFVGDYYVLYSSKVKEDPSLEDQARQLLKRWEKGDPETLALWRMMNKWVLDGFQATFDEMGFEFDVVYKESETYLLGKDIAALGLTKGLFKEDESGAVICPLPESEFGLNKDGSEKKATIQRSDGTSVYLTQDIGTSIKKVEDYAVDESIHVVGDEQKFHFKCLFYILKELGYEWAIKSHHLSYGMVLLPDGKMKSREGTVVDADELIDEVVGHAEDWIRGKWQDSIDQDEIARRAHVIGTGAIKFYLLNANPNKSIQFVPADSISFDGVTGPYCQYAYARARSALAKRSAEIDHELVNHARLGAVPEERALALSLLFLAQKVQAGVTRKDPSTVTDACYHLSKALNQFYTKCPLLTDDPSLSAARYNLMMTASESLKQTLSLLDIDVLEEM